MPWFSKNPDGAGGGTMWEGGFSNYGSVPRSHLDHLDMQYLENNIYMLRCLRAEKLFWAGKTAESKIAQSIYALSAEPLFAILFCVGFFGATQDIFQRNQKSTPGQTKPKKAQRTTEKKKEIKESKQQLGSHRLRPVFWKLLQPALPVILYPYLQYNLLFSCYSPPEQRQIIMLNCDKLYGGFEMWASTHKGVGQDHLNPFHLWLNIVG